MQPNAPGHVQVEGQTSKIVDAHLHGRKLADRVSVSCEPSRDPDAEMQEISAQAWERS